MWRAQGICPGFCNNWFDHLATERYTVNRLLRLLLGPQYPQFSHFFKYMVPRIYKVIPDRLWDAGSFWQKIGIHISHPTQALAFCCRAWNFVPAIEVYLLLSVLALLSCQLLFILPGLEVIAPFSSNTHVSTCLCLQSCIFALIFKWPI